MEKGVTVLICSYNSATRITQTIEHLAAQEFTKPFSWELIFVDNASTDHCGQLAQSIWEKRAIQNDGFSLIRENKPGKIYALHLGVSRARFEYFVICDDDNWLAPDYIQTVYDFLENTPKSGAVGGQGIAVTEGQPLPAWFPDYGKHYASGGQDDVSCDITRRRGYLWGAGLASRTSLYKSMYSHFPSFLIGRKGKELIGGEDTEYCLRLVLKGWRLHYDSRLVFQHFMPPNRLEPAYRDRLVHALDGDGIVLEKYYLAIKMQFKCTGRPWNTFRLRAITPFRWLLAISKKKRAVEKNKLRFLFPFSKRSDPVMFLIKKFITDKTSG
jgi:glycosyltransferase involved in cell wall biosynthesis